MLLGFILQVIKVWQHQLLKLTATASIDTTFDVGTGILPANTVKFILLHMITHNLYIWWVIQQQVIKVWLWVELLKLLRLVI